MITERFLYEIHPHRPIRNLIPGRLIVKPCSMKLTKEEVSTAMNSGPVFRIFSGQMPIRVTGSNMDLLHVAKYEEYKIKEKMANHTQKLENDVIAQEPVLEEPKTEAPRKEEPVENPAPVETEIPAEVPETEVEPEVEPEVEAIEEPEEEEVEPVTTGQFSTEEEIAANNVSLEETIQNLKDITTANVTAQAPTVTVNTYNNNKNYYKKKKH